LSPNNIFSSSLSGFFDHANDTQQLQHHWKAFSIRKGTEKAVAHSKSRRVVVDGEFRPLFAVTATLERLSIRVLLQKKFSFWLSL
jgi:hypothetical protein